MSSSGGSLNTCVDSHHHNSYSSFSSFSFTDLLSNNDDSKNPEKGSASSAFSWGISAPHDSHEIPKFKSFPPASLPISPSPVSPSSFLNIPPALSPSVLLDSPVFFSTSNVSSCAGFFNAVLRIDFELFMGFWSIILGVEFVVCFRGF